MRQGGTLQVKRKMNLPKNVPMKKGVKGTLMTGDTMLMNQLGRNGVILRNMI